jgi:segregation and condensation protein A
LSLRVQLQQFEGPLALLLYLIRKEEMDIFDINVHQITSQYLDYIRRMKTFDLEVAGDFIAMAATLLQIKSQMLLPNYDEEGQPVEDEDPRKQLVQKLLEYQKFQEASKKLNSRPLLYRDQWPRGVKETFVSDEEPEIDLEEGGLFSLIGLYRKVIRKVGKSVHQVGAKSQSIASRVREIRALLQVGIRIAMSSLLRKEEPTERRREVLITFLSLLELAKMGFVSLFQTEVFKDIYIQTTREIGSDVADLVHEYDAQDAEAVAGKIMQEAEIEGLKVAQDLQAALEEENTMATDEEIAQAEQEMGYTDVVEREGEHDAGV